MTMNLELMIIGSGTAALSERRGPSGYVVTVDAETYLLDGGTGTLLKCLQAGFSYREMDKLFYTHMHPDHTMDFVPFLFATKYTPEFTRQKPLDIFGPVGFKRFYEQLTDLFDPGLRELGFPVNLVELEKDKLNLGAVTIETNRMNHSKTAIGYRFEAGDKTFVYSGDTGICDEIVHLARDADLLLLECSFPDDMKVAKHLTPTEAGRIASAAGVKKVVLTHLYPPCDNIDIKSIVQGEFEGEVIVAEDFMKIMI